jgi:hypothetical protein
MAAPERHVTNQSAFLSMDATNLVFNSYCRLVALELALKGINTIHYSRLHNVAGMIQAQYAHHSAVCAAANALSATLSRITCSGRDGKPTPVSHSKYPDLRYARCDTDFSASNTPTSTLVNLKTTLDNLLAALHKEGLCL